MKVAAEVDELLQSAIEQKRLIEFHYHSKRRIAEPHDYGIRKGSIKLLCYQVGGSSSEPLPNWRWIEVDLISDLRLLNRTFRGGRRSDSGKHHSWDEVFKRVEPPEDGEVE